MFADAIEKAVQFTRPVVAVYGCQDGECRSSVGTFVVVNRDGWILTACHMDQGFRNLTASIDATREHKKRIAAIQANSSLTKGARKVALKKLGDVRGDAPLSFALWWSWDGVKLVDVELLPAADLMVGRLEPFDPAWVITYPVFKDPATPIRQGSSLCRLGYPFPSVKATYDSTTDRFNMSQLGLPVFPIEGILTRTVDVSENPAGYRNRFIETSSPGLKGQSGGPILDIKGTVWGIQSQTSHLSLGFDPVVPSEDGKASTKKEHQFLNVGWAAHPESVVGLLRERAIQHTLAP